VKKFVFFVMMSLVMVWTGCEKQLDTPPTYDSPSTMTDHDATSRASTSYNVSLTNFRYVWQNRRPTSWTDDTKYAGSGYPCAYPRYSGSYTFTEGGNTNLCGLTSYMMGVHLVNHPALFDVPYGTNDRAIRLVEYAKRYKSFDGGYYFGGYTSLYNIGSMSNGLSGKKGDLTNWSYCTTYTGSGTSWGGTTNRTSARDFMKNKIAVGRPCVALIRVKTSSGCNDSDCSTYISTSSNSGIGHMVLVVGITIDGAGDLYGKVRFKDPWPNNSKTYEINLNTFLSSMYAASSSGVYNVLGINGL
jgi:hypothetical protein